MSTRGIVIGVAALVSVLSVGDGMERLARERIGRTTDLQRIVMSARQLHIIDGAPFPVANPVKFTDAEVTALEALLGESVFSNMMVNGSALVTTRAT